MRLQKILRPWKFVQNKLLFFYGGIGGVVLLVVVAAAVAICQLHEQAERRTLITSQNLAKSLELTFDGLIDTINMALLTSSDEITHQISHGKPDAPAITRMFDKQQAHIPHIPYIRATNEKGDVIYGPGLTRPFNVADRDYFTYLRDNKYTELFISKPLVSVFSHKWIWTFARRINKPDGSFGGVIYAPIYIDEIHDIFSKMDIGPGSSITLRDQKYRLIYRYAPSSTENFPIGDTRLSNDLKKALAKNIQEGSYTNRIAYSDGTIRIHSYYRNFNHGFTVIVGLSREAAFAEWRGQAWIVGWLVLFFIIAMAVLSRMISRSWKQQERAIASLMVNEASLQEAVASLQVSQRSLREAQKIARLGQYTYVLRSDRWVSSDVLDDIFGIGEEYSRIARGWLELGAPECREEMESHLKSVIEKGQPFDLRYRIIRPCDGQERWVHGKGELQFNEAGEPMVLFGTIQDISQSMAHQVELVRIANFDTLTGLPNRRLLVERLTHAIAHARSGGTTLAVCYIDLDNFKPINDRFGHEAGDRLLQTIPQLLEEVLRDNDTLARFGGDEFILLLGGLAHAEEPIGTFDRILAALNAEVELDGITVQLSASMGVTLFPYDDADADTLLRHADYAMYLAKEAGKNRYQLFDSEHSRQVQEHLYNLHRLSEALANDEFVLHYQPKVDLLSGQIIGAEALIRWQHPEQGLLTPGKFLLYIEGSNLEIEVGEWVINSVLRQIEAWHVDGMDLSVSVNVSANHLLRPNFSERLRLSLERHPNVDPVKLELEILETAAMSDIEQAVDVLTRCREYGIKISLDDFGTGYSSLTYFRRLPIDVLKIDQSFVRDMLDRPDDFDLVRNVVQLARAFNRRVIAEGVETMEHGFRLAQIGCHLVQGYGIARPMPAEYIAGWADDWRKKKAWLTDITDQTQSAGQAEPTIAA